jgi:ribosome recycling factor
VPIPPLTTERRASIVKQLGEVSEDCLIVMRNARHEAIKESESAKKSKDITEDDYHTVIKQIDEQMTKYKNTIESLVDAKEKEIMTV